LCQETAKTIGGECGRNQGGFRERNKEKKVASLDWGGTERQKGGCEWKYKNDLRKDREEKGSRPGGEEGGGAWFEDRGEGEGLPWYKGYAEGGIVLMGRMAREGCLWGSITRKKNKP